MDYHILLFWVLIIEVNLPVAYRHSSLYTRTSVSNTPTQTPEGVDCVVRATHTP
jgi:hypothetical protein